MHNKDIRMRRSLSTPASNVQSGLLALICSVSSDRRLILSEHTRRRSPILIKYPVAGIRMYTKSYKNWLKNQSNTF